MTRRRALIAAWVLLLGLSATLPVSAFFHGIVHVGTSSLTFPSPPVKPVISLGSSVLLSHGSRAVVVVFAGDIRLTGTASDDLVDVGGRVYLARGSRVTGDVLSLGGAIYKAPHATVSGQMGGAVRLWSGGTWSNSVGTQPLLANSIRFGLAAGLALLLIGTCITIVFPWQVVLIASTLRGAPVKSAAAGMTNLLIFTFLAVPLGLSLAGLPFAVLLTGAAVLAWLFGLTASAVVLGRALARGTVSLVWATAAGLVVLALSMAVPFVGPLTITAVGLAGTGALAVALLDRSRPSTGLP